MRLLDSSFYTYEKLERDLSNLARLYPQILEIIILGRTADGRKLYCVVAGDKNAEKKIFINAGIHGREYMTSQLVMKQLTVLAERTKLHSGYRGYTYESLFRDTAIYIMPMVNPDGISISQNGIDRIQKDAVKEEIIRIAGLDGQSPDRTYFTKWKANANGVDLNRNFDARWEDYRGVSHPSAAHYKGAFAGCEEEAKAMTALTINERFRRTISYHAQGSIIYWYFGQRGQLYQDSYAFADRISGVTGYPLSAECESPDPAGYKDWAISRCKIPSLTIEIGRETAPVPGKQFQEIWERNRYVFEETMLDVKGWV